MNNFKNTFHKITILSLIVLSCLNLYNSIFSNISLIFLTENQILYIYSALAQIIGALLGLIIAGYSIIDSKIKTLGDEDHTITDYTDELRHEYFTALIYIIVLSIMDILFCLIVLSIYNNIFHICLSFFMTETIIIFVFIMIFTFHFVCYLNPSKLQEKGSIEKEDIEKDYSSLTTEQTDTFSPFVTYYNLLDKLVKTYACELTDNQIPVYKIQIFEALDILLRHEIINKETYNQINELRRYRNALVHSLDTDKTVETNIYNNLEKIYTLLKAIYDNRSDNDLFVKNKAKLYEYSHNQGYGSIENEILLFLSTNTASTNEIANHLNISRASTVRKLQSLQNLNLIEKTEANKQLKWKVK